MSESYPHLPRPTFEEHMLVQKNHDGEMNHHFPSLENRGFTGPKIAGGRDAESEATVSIQMLRLPKE